MSISEPEFIAWVRKAENDLLNVRNNLLAAQVPWDTVCFHCQQAGEKLLKAFLLYQGLDPERSHDLTALLGACCQFDSALAVLSSDCNLLTSYGVASRYPDEFHEPDELDGKSAVAAVEHVKAAILARLPQIA